MSEDDIRNGLHQLSQDGSIQLQQLIHDNQSFGNMVVLMTISGLDVKLVRDRGDIWWELMVPGEPAEWFLLDDVMNSLRIPVPSRTMDVVEEIKVTIGHVQQHVRAILKALDAEHVTVTRQKVHEIVKQRVSQTYGFTPKD